MTEFSSEEKNLLHQLFSPESITSLVEKFPSSSIGLWETIYSKILGSSKGLEDLILYVDGAANMEKKTAGIGGIFYRKGNEEDELFSFSEYIGKATNNEAEYSALLKGLEYAKQLNGGNIIVYSDSELIVNQLNLEFKVKNDQLRKLHRKCRALLGNFTSWKVEHISRIKNRKADNLSKQALKEGKRNTQ